MSALSVCFGCAGSVNSSISRSAWIRGCTSEITAKLSQNSVKFCREPTIAIERRIQTISSARLTVPPEIRAIPTGKTKAIEDGRIAWLMLINGQQCLYHFVVMSRTFRTADWNRPIEEAVWLNALMTSIPLTYSTMVAFILALDIMYSFITSPRPNIMP